MAPLILENLTIVSGHLCNQCDPYSLEAFSCITSEHFLILKRCHVIACQGSGIVAKPTSSEISSSPSHLILQENVIESPYYSIYCSFGSEMILESSWGNLFGMSETWYVQKMAD